LNITINDINKSLFQSKELGVHNNNLFVLEGYNLNSENENKNRINTWKISFREFSRYNIENINLSYFEKNKSELTFLKDCFIILILKEKLIIKTFMVIPRMIIVS